MRQIISLSRDWLFFSANDERAKLPSFREDAVEVTLPHSTTLLPHNNFSESEYAKITWYRREIFVPAEAAGRQVSLDFDGVMLAAQLYVNGVEVGEEHLGGFTPFSRDISQTVNYGENNFISVRVDSRERSDIPPFGNLVDYLTFGGIYRDVYLRINDIAHVENVFARPSSTLEQTKSLSISVTLEGFKNFKTSVSAILFDRSGMQVGTTTLENVSLESQHSVVEIALDGLEGIELWTLDNPVLYRLEVSLSNGDSVSTSVGFRTAEFREDGAFYLNGKTIKLRGLNRHQSFPYIGMAAPKRLQQRDADIIKFELGCNIVRTSHYPQSPYFLDRCDEIGLLVLEEIPGWQHIGDDGWQQVSLSELRAMVIRDRNHPSVIMWGVRINESSDHNAFYTKTNALARALDPTRATGGIRCIHESELLEDVYTMNDFMYDLASPGHNKYLVTEYGGHMFPTKSFDQEERMVQHAMHHAHVMNQAHQMPIAGSIGWCAFDYNTHAQFGSGDRICHHGVMDIFREPKMAAGVYASQVGPSQKIVLEHATYWTRGDRDRGEISPLWIFSNLERVEVLIDGKKVAEAEKSLKFSHLPYPPFLVDRMPGGWGDRFGELELRGYSGGVLAKTQFVAADGIVETIILKSDHDTLLADGSDMTRITLRAQDQYGNICPFAFEAVSLELEGPAEIIGPNPCSLIGGRVSLFLKSTGQIGEITLRARTARKECIPLKIVVVSE